MASNLDSVVWTNSFDPPPQKGPPPKIPLPKPPTQSQIRSNSLSPMSNPPGNEYFNSVNFSPKSPPRLPPKGNVRAPVLHRLSETDSINEADSFDPVPGPRFRGTSNGSPVSPYTLLDQDGTLPTPTAFDLDKSGRKGSGSSLGTQQSRMSRGRSLQLMDEHEEPAPFVMKSDKHKRILGIDSKATPVKKPPQKSESLHSISGGLRRKRSIPDVHARANSPLPAPDVVPFLYQDIEVRPLIVSLTCLGCATTTRR
jgi:hypothetical protein